MKDLSAALAEGALVDLEDDLRARAYLFDAPAVYRDAVEEVFDALRAMIARYVASAA